MKRLRKHWYHITTYYCPICSSEDTYRVRRYGRRPKRWDRRHVIHEAWDYCGAL